MSTPDLRLRMREPASTDGHIDGAWWPHSRDLVQELAPLLDELRVAGNPIGRVIYDRASWKAETRRVRVGDRVVRLGGFSMPDTEIVSFIDNTGSRKRLDVLVVPPDADPAYAERLLALASTSGSNLRAAEIVTQSAGVTPSAGVGASA